MPLLLAAAGVAILIGCIPIPSPRWSQSDGRPRSEHFVGNSSKKSVWIGHTRIEDAFIELSRRIGSEQIGSGLMGGHPIHLGRNFRLNPMWSLIRWRVSPDKPQLVLSYSITTMTWIAPLCFTAWTDDEQRWLVLNVDPDGIVTSTVTTREAPLTESSEPGRWLEIFDQPTRQKLFNAGVFPSDETLIQVRTMGEKALMKMQEQREEARRRAATRSMNR